MHSYNSPCSEVIKPNVTQVRKFTCIIFSVVELEYSRTTSALVSIAAEWRVNLDLGKRWHRLD